MDTQLPATTVQSRLPPLLDDVTERYLTALLSGDCPAAELVVTRALSSGWSLHDIYVRVFQEALYEVGRRWEQSRLTIAQEHFCTAATQQIMASLYNRLTQTPRTGKRLLATSLGGNLHAVGIRMLADIFEIHGWETTYLGADVPAAAILEKLALTPCDVLAISATLDEHVHVVASLITTLRASPLAQGLKILVGGGAFNRAPDLWRQIGADGHATTPEGALRCANGDPTDVPIAAIPLTLRKASPRTEGDAMLAAMSRINNDLNDTTRRLAEQNLELIRLNDQVNRLMGVAAHDLRNPLTTIIMNSELLHEDLAGCASAEQLETLALIEEAGAYMKRLLDDLLDVTKIRAGKLALRRVQVELVGFVSGVTKLSVGLAHRKRIELHFTASHPTIEVAIDRDKLQQVITNLVGNAIQYSPAGARVEVALELAGDEVVLAVHDRGKGIEAAELDKVFRPFETTATTGTAGEKSTGLGLAIVHAIVAAHGGHVWVDSVIDEGTSFFVKTPRAA